MSCDVADTGSSDTPVISVTPRAVGAAEITTTVVPDEVTTTSGGTHVCLRLDEETPALVERVVEAVLSGRFVERGPRGDAFAEVNSADGEQRSGGDGVASLRPGRWGRRFAPCT